MRTYLLLSGLVVGNVLGIVGLLGVFPSYAQSGLDVSDLTYGGIDADGDGKYTMADDWIVEWLVTNEYQHLEKAVKSANVNADGGVDVSPYLKIFTAERILESVAK